MKEYPLRSIVGQIWWNCRKERMWAFGDAEWRVAYDMLECGHAVKPRENRIYKARCKRCAAEEVVHDED